MIFFKVLLLSVLHADDLVYVLQDEAQRIFIQEANSQLGDAGLNFRFDPLIKAYDETLNEGLRPLTDVLYNIHSVCLPGSLRNNSYLAVASFMPSSLAVQASPLFENFCIPLSCALASCEYLDKFYNFIRIIPADNVQVKALMAVVQALNAPSVAVYYGSDTYAVALANAMSSSLAHANVCVTEFVQIHDDMAQNIQGSKSNVSLVIANIADAKKFFKIVSNHDLFTNRIFIGTDGWSTQKDILVYAKKCKENFQVMTTQPVVNSTDAGRYVFSDHIKSLTLRTLLDEQEKRGEPPMMRPLVRVLLRIHNCSLYGANRCHGNETIGEDEIPLGALIRSEFVKDSIMRLVRHFIKHVKELQSSGATTDREIVQTMSGAKLWQNINDQCSDESKYYRDQTRTENDNLCSPTTFGIFGINNRNGKWERMGTWITDDISKETHKGTLHGTDLLNKLSKKLDLNEQTCQRPYSKTERCNKDLGNLYPEVQMPQCCFRCEPCKENEIATSTGCKKCSLYEVAKQNYSTKGIRHTCVSGIVYPMLYENLWPAFLIGVAIIMAILCLCECSFAWHYRAKVAKLEDANRNRREAERQLAELLPGSGMDYVIFQGTLLAIYYVIMVWTFFVNGLKCYQALWSVHSIILTAIVLINYRHLIKIIDSTEERINAQVNYMFCNWKECLHSSVAITIFIQVIFCIVINFVTKPTVEYFEQQNPSLQFIPWFYWPKRVQQALYALPAIAQLMTAHEALIKLNSISTLRPDRSCVIGQHTAASLAMTVMFVVLFSGMTILELDKTASKYIFLAIFTLLTGLIPCGFQVFTTFYKIYRIMHGRNLTEINNRINRRTSRITRRSPVGAMIAVNRHAGAQQPQPIPAQAAASAGITGAAPRQRNTRVRRTGMRRRRDAQVHTL